MKKEQLWDHFAGRNPSFNGSGKVTMSARGLRKLFDQTYDIAHAQGLANGRGLEGMEREKQQEQEPFADLLGLFKRGAKA